MNHIGRLRRATVTSINLSHLPHRLPLLPSTPHPLPLPVRPSPNPRSSTSLSLPLPLLASIVTLTTATTLTQCEPPPPPPPPLPQSPWNSLLSKVASADPSALHSLTLLLTDPTQTSVLLSAGLLPALTAALTQATSDNPTISINALRILADLAKTDARTHFTLSTLAPITAVISRAAPDTWFAYIRRTLSLTPTPSDIDPGAAYHALRCISNLANHAHLHPLLRQSDVLRPLCRALLDVREPDLSADEERADMVRALILAVAALAKTCAPDVVAYGAHRPLVAFAAGGADVVAQMYAAGGVRNLARHNGDTSWGVHRELVVVDCVTALVRAMEADDVQTKRFGVLAFGDLMLSGHHKVRLIRLRLRNAFEPFAKLMRDAHPGVAQVVIRVLTDLFNGGEGVVPKELGELIAKECGQLVNGCVKRGDVSALKCVRAMCQDEIVAQGMVDNGLIEVLISGVRGGKGECLEQSIAALYELSSRAELMPLIVSRGGLRAVIQRPCLEHDAIWAASFLANVARKSEYQAEVSHGALRVLLIATTSKNEHAIREGVRALYNLSLGGVSKVMVCQGGGLLPLIKVARNSSGETRRLAIGAIAELSASLDQATTLIEGGVVSVLLDSVREDDSLQRDVARCLGQLSQVPEVHGSLARSGAATWLVEMVQQNGGRGLDSSDVLYFATVSLSNLAYSAGIGRDAVRDSGVGRVLTALSSAGMSGQMVLNVARQALNNLRGAEKPVLLQLETPGRSGVAA